MSIIDLSGDISSSSPEANSSWEVEETKSESERKPRWIRAKGMMMTVLHLSIHPSFILTTRPKVEITQHENMQFQPGFQMSNEAKISINVGDILKKNQKKMVISP